jgi:hypothetical protein
MAPPTTPITNDDYSATPTTAYNADSIAASADANAGGASIGLGSALGGIGSEAQATQPITVNSPAFGATTIGGYARPYTATWQSIVDSLRTSRDKPTLMRVQQQLLQAGMYDDSYYATSKPGKYVPQAVTGVFDQATSNALNNALGYATVRNLPLEQALAESTSIHRTDVQRRQQAEAEAAKANYEYPRVYFAQTATGTVPDADAVALTVDSVAQQLIGRELTPDEKAPIVSSTMAQLQALVQAQTNVEAANSAGIGVAQGLENQMRVQTNQAEAAQSGQPNFQAPAGAQVVGGATPGQGQTFITGGGTAIFQDVNPQAEAAKQVEDQYAAEVKKYRLTQQYNVLAQMIAGAGR